MASLASIDRRVKALERDSISDDIPHVDIIRLIPMGADGPGTGYAEVRIQKPGETFDPAVHLFHHVDPSQK